MQSSSHWCLLYTLTLYCVSFGHPYLQTCWLFSLSEIQIASFFCWTSRTLAFGPASPIMLRGYRGSQAISVTGPRFSSSLFLRMEDSSWRLAMTATRSAVIRRRRRRNHSSCFSQLTFRLSPVHSEHHLVLPTAFPSPSLTDYFVQSCPYLYLSLSHKTATTDLKSPPTLTLDLHPLRVPLSFCHHSPAPLTPISPFPVSRPALKSANVDNVGVRRTRRRPQSLAPRLQSDDRQAAPIFFPCSSASDSQSHQVWMMFKLLERAAPGPQPLHRNRPQRLRLGTRRSVYLARLLSYSRPVETTIVNPLLKTLNK